MSFHRFGFGVFVFAVSWLVAPAAMGQAQVNAVLSMEYTGGLFGYYRMEPGETQEPRLRPVAAFLKNRQGNDRLLLGMGDNFGPEFGAALQLENLESENCMQPVPQIAEERYGRGLPPVVLYKDDIRIANYAHCDNVALFLMRAGYRAVVPGREDFLYSAKWLRGIALGLRAEVGTDWIKNKEEKVTLLAGNLRAEGDKGCALLFAPATQGAAAKETECVASASGEKVPTAQDWVERLDLTLDERRDVALEIQRRANETVSIRRQLLINEVNVTLTALSDAINPAGGAQGCVDANVVEKVKDLTTEKGYKIEGDLVVANQDLVKAVGSFDSQVENQCMMGSRDEVADRKTVTAELVRVFSIRKPQFCDPELHDEKQEATQCVFFRDTVREAQSRLLLRVIGREEMDVGYTFADTFADGKPGAKIIDRKLLIGVIGRETMGAVSPTSLEMDAAMKSKVASKAGGSVVAPATVEVVPATNRARPVDFDFLEKKTVTVLDPRRTVAMLVRAASQIAPELDGVKARLIDSTIVMAQMPRTETEELGAHLREDFRKLPGSSKNLLRVDLILSEAQIEHASPDVSLDYGRDDMTPVLTPHPAFDTGEKELVQPVSVAALEEKGGARRSLNNSRRTAQDKFSITTTLFLLEQQLGTDTDEPLLTTEEEKTRAIEIILRELQLNSHADVVVLERRDLYLDSLPNEYSDYSVCHKQLSIALPKDWQKHCEMHVALDRILWKGDYSERVMVSGKDLKAILKTAQDQVVEQESLAARDTLDQWLVTFGVTTSDKKDLSRLESNGDRFDVPWSEECQGDKSAKEAQYCVNGSVISDDAGYWVATSDHIANDPVLYSVLRGEPAGYHKVKQVQLMRKGAPEELFLTDELTKTMIEPAQMKVAGKEITEGQTSARGTMLQAHQEDRSLVHLDFAKLVAGFNIRHPEGGNAAAAGFQGVTDTRPSQPNQQELDLETMSRLSSDILTQSSPYALRSNPYSFSVGVQTDVEYDRSAQGNLTGKPVNASYALNNFSVGGFIQKRVPFWGDAKTREGNWASRELPRTLLVLTPYQYQQQLTGNFLFLNFSAGNGELTVHSPTVTGHAYKVGIRHETTRGRRLSFDRGSYWEEGFEYVVQNNVGRSLTLTTPDAPPSQMPTKTCKANGTSTLQQCFSTSSNPPFTVDGTTFVVKPYDLVTLPVSGLYWDIHLQRGLWKDAKSGEVKVNLTVDTKGDFYGERQSSLSTQTRYAFPITGAVSFPVLRNFSLGPTYSAFLYSNQVSQQSIVVHTFSISARWFYDRDSGVPFPRMTMFKGPGSQDQTKTAKIK